MIFSKHQFRALVAQPQLQYRVLTFQQLPQVASRVPAETATGSPLAPRGAGLDRVSDCPVHSKAPRRALSPLAFCS